MKLLGLFLKALLFLLIVLILLGLLTVLAWWLRWPMFTGFFILAGLFGAVLLFWAGRFLWRARNKRFFVRQALSGLKNTAVSTETHLSGIEGVWNALLARDRQKRIDPREFTGRSWYLALDGAARADAPLSPLFAAEDEDKPLARRDFAATTLLHMTVGALEGKSGEELLALIARDVRDSAIAGVLLIVSAREVLARGESALHEWGFQLRGALYTAMVALNRNLPIYVLAQDMETLPGGAALLSRPKGEAALPGCFFDPDANGHVKKAPGEAAAEAADAMLRAAFYDDLAQGAPAGADELHFLETIGQLGKKLDVLFAALLQDMPRQDSARLAGVFFCPTRPPEVAAKKATGQPPVAPEPVIPTFPPPSQGALSRFLTRFLPSHGATAYRLRGRLSAYSGAWIVVMGAWCLLLFCVCGLMAANVLYQNRAITSLPPSVAQHLVSGRLDVLYGEMRYIMQIEAARKNWLLPAFGLDMLARVEQAEKNRFTKTLYGEFLAPMLVSMRATLNAPGEYDEAKHAAVNQLAWLGHAIRQQQETGKIDVPAISFPLFAEESWGTANSELIKLGLEWTASPEQLAILGEDVSGILIPFLTRNFESFYDSIIWYYDESNSDQKVCLSQYWPSLFGNAQEDTCVPASYTAAGYAVNKKFLHRFLGMPGGEHMQLRQKMDRVLEDYYARYEEQWQNFVQRFCEVAESLENSDAYVPFYHVRSVEDTPHLRLAARLTKELAPLKDASTPPAWLSEARLFDVMTQVALEGHASQDLADWHTLLITGIAAPDVLRELWQVADTRHQVRRIYDGITQMARYFGSVRSILKNLDNPAWAQATARTHFGARDTEALENSLYTQGGEHWRNVRETFQNHEIPQLRLFENLLAFAGNGITVSAATTLQHDWENQVLASPTYLHRGYDTALMFGQEGVMSKFVADEISPFLLRRTDGIAAAVWDNRPFPFTQDFLSFLGSGEEFAITAATEKQTPGVLLRAMPTLVNVEAKARVNSTTLTLWCQDKTWQLVNRNYPHNERFTYDKQQCGKTELAIAFPNFEAKRVYPDFVSFVEDFQYGERRFTPQDFPEASDFLAADRISNLKVRIFPDNVALLLKEKNNNIPEAPDRITYVR
ncbi:MAG: hypothetical protein LBO79_06715 [Zoogloeaceae bacterium]|jgi:type VI secretion system protein ImpL|nr:hypothetical protein [Zoogloeaceae bacterium]